MLQPSGSQIDTLVCISKRLLRASAPERQRNGFEGDIEEPNGATLPS